MQSRIFPTAFNRRKGSWYHILVEFSAWALENWFELLQSAVIVAGLCFTALEFRRQSRAVVTGNRLAITAAHRDLTLFRLSHPELLRVYESKADLVSNPLTAFELDWLSLVFLHFSVCFSAMEKGQYEKPDRLVEDVRSFLNLPVPQAAWKRSKRFQNERFVAFVEQCLRSEGRKRTDTADVLSR